ncbi:hypothetical protein HYY69_07985 [Candidatus Woesearchaeota archaeon]|nr:hypothetical protein [Candidatus Woesearchaeota archaeon]
MNLKKIQNILSSHQEIDGWRIFLRKIERKNIYILKQFEIEDILEGQREDISVKVYKYFGDEIGDAEFPVATDDEKVLQRQLADAVFICSLSRKKKYTLPKPEQLMAVPKLWDKEIAQITTNQFITLVSTFKNELQKYSNVKLNSMELHTSTAKFHVLNSNGVDLSTEKTHVFVEFIITAFEDSKEQEFVASASYARLADFDIANFVQEKVAIVKDVLHAQQPSTFSGNVLLKGDALHEFFVPHLQLGPLTMHCSAKLKYMDLSCYKKGTSLGTFKGDKITLTTNPFLDYNPASALFDEDGVVSKPLSLIEEGVFKNYFASQQYADYLSIQPTGSLGTLEVASGSKTETELTTKDRVEIVSFASYVPDAISGAFSAEIRLGYFIKNGLRTPFRGGMFTGNVFDLIKNCSLSKEKISLDSYVGPKLICFHKGTVAGLKT